MNKKFAGILLCIGLLISVFPVSGIINYNANFYWNMIQGDTTSLSIKEPFILVTGGRNNSPPYQPNNPVPPNGSVNISINPILQWEGGDPDGDPVNYSIYFGDISPPPQVIQNQTNLEYIPGTLNYNTLYFWQIIAWDNQSEYNASPIWEFTTLSAPNQPPNIPSNPSPNNGSSGVNINVDLSWTGDDPDGDNVTYDVYFGNSTSPPIAAHNITQSLYDPGTLTIQTTYHWKIVAWDIHGLSTIGPRWTFTTQANTPPTKPEITIGPHFAGPSILINFSAIASDPEGDPIYYKWDWGDGNESEWIGPYNLSQQHVTNYTYYFTGTYEIRVKARDVKNAEGPWSDIHQLTIAPQIELTNLNPGFVYFNIFMFNRSYAFIYALSVLDITMMITTTGMEFKASASDAVKNVKFEAFNPVWGEGFQALDTNLSDGIDVYMSLSTGLWQVTAYAIDEDGTIIDYDMNYLFFIGIGSGGGGQTIGGRMGTLRNRLANLFFN